MTTTKTVPVEPENELATLRAKVAALAEEVEAGALSCGSNTALADKLRALLEPQK